MPELPDVEVYVECVADRIVGRDLEQVRLGSPFVLRSVEPRLSAAHGRTVESVSRLGKRIVVALSGDLYLVVHLMVAGRLAWLAAGAKLPRRVGLAAFDFAHGSLLLREAATKKRASLHLASGSGGLAAFDRGGLEIAQSSSAEFSDRLRSENHTLKRSLTDPRLFSGIGNAYSDEILHHARLSPLRLTSRLEDDEAQRLHRSAKAVLREWHERLRQETGEDFPRKVTAFRPEMAVHGRYGKACPDCGSPVQRIVYAENECNYCAVCQNGGRLLADRALSRLLHKDWPKNLEELDDLKLSHRAEPQGDPS